MAVPLVACCEFCETKSGDGSYNHNGCTMYASNEHPVHIDEYSCHDSWQAYMYFIHVDGVVHLQNTFCTTCRLALSYVHLQC